MGLNKIQCEFAQDIAALVCYVAEMGYGCRFEYAYRDEDTQRKLVDRGLSWTMNSLHLDRLAVDFTFFAPSGAPTWNQNELQVFGDFWESLHEDNNWGGNWVKPDVPHFERAKP